MDEKATIAEACTSRALTLLNYALRDGFKTQRDVNEDAAAIVEAHRLLECATMLGSLT